MAWFYKKGKGTEQLITVGKAWSDDDGIQHPPNWIVWSDAYKNKMEVVEWNIPIGKSYDSNFYYSDGRPQDLTKLKSAKISELKGTVGAYLNSSDWYILRKAERDVAIPSNIATYRAALHTELAKKEKAITDAKDLDAFIKLHDDDTLTSWPVLGS